MKLYSISLFIMLAIVASFAYVALASDKALTIEVKTAQDSPIKKELLVLAREMEKTAEIYQLDQFDQPERQDVFRILPKILVE